MISFQTRLSVFVCHFGANLMREAALELTIKTELKKNLSKQAGLRYEIKSKYDDDINYKIIKTCLSLNTIQA
jgi:hypothetical protein